MTPQPENRQCLGWNRSFITSGRKAACRLNEYLESAPTFAEPSLQKKPSAELTRAGMVGLDGRYLNFAPQCTGWHELTQNGGSGSFLIFWSGLSKLTTAASIPYYTGYYGNNPRGFGYVTIGANVEEFHRPANDTAKHIQSMVDNYVADIDNRQAANRQMVVDNVKRTLNNLAISTLFMSILVIIVAVWIATFMTNRIRAMIGSIRIFQRGNFDVRLPSTSKDEMGDLSRAFNSMADSLKESIGQLEEARDKANESNRLKSEFLANISHELRTPLNGIHGFAEVLESELAPDSEQREYAKIIIESSQHLYGLVNDLLDIAKIEAGHIEYKLEKVALHEIINEVVNLHRMSAKQKNVTVNVDIAGDFPEKVVCDKVRIRQVLNNLVHNAVKFTEEGRITVTAGREDGNAVITVEDTGLGIPLESQREVFEQFRQVDDFITRRYGGTGLGLFLVRELILGHGRRG